MHLTSSEATRPAGEWPPLSCHRSLCKGVGVRVHTAWLHARLPWVHMPRAISRGRMTPVVWVEALLHLGRVAQLAQVSRGFFRSWRLKITQAFVASCWTTAMELISGKPSMREGPAHWDLPFGQMIFPEMCQLSCCDSKTAQPTPAHNAVVRFTEFSESRPPYLFLWKLSYFKQESSSYGGRIKVQEQVRVLNHCHLVTSNHHAQWSS